MRGSWRSPKTPETNAHGPNRVPRVSLAGSAMTRRPEGKSFQRLHNPVTLTYY